MKKLVVLALLTSLSAFSFSQNVLRPEKVVIFNDAAWVSLKGILRFHDNIATVSPGFDFVPGSVQIIHSPDLDLQYIKFKRDTILKPQPVRSWRDVLLANRRRKVNIVYEIGNEFDELSGEVRIIDPQSGLFILRTGPGTEFFIPYSQVRQVMVDSVAISRVHRKVEGDVIELKLEQEVPFAPFQVTGLLKGVSWKPGCFIRMEDEKTAIYELKADLVNNSQSINGVEIQLSGQSILGNPSAVDQESGRISLGQLELANGDRMQLNLAKTKYDYEAQYITEIPWVGLKSDEMPGPLPVKFALGFNNPVQISGGCSIVSIHDISGNHLAEVKLDAVSNEGVSSIPLSNEGSIDIRYQESVPKKGTKEEKAGVSFLRSEVEGKLIITNQKSENVVIRVTREIEGEVKEKGGGSIERVKGSPRQNINWRFPMKAGQKREVIYQYDALIPEKE